MINLYKIYNEVFKKYGASYDAERVRLDYKGIQMFAKKKQYICFKVSNINNQQEIDDIDSKYQVNVHFGNYEKPKHIDISKFHVAKEDKAPYLGKCYFSCDFLSDADMISLFDYLVGINDSTYKHELLD